jgi:hypothetical protein
MAIGPDDVVSMDAGECETADRDHDVGGGALGPV